MFLQSIITIVEESLIAKIKLLEARVSDNSKGMFVMKLDSFLLLKFFQ